MASPLSREEVGTFITALQISIDSQIMTWEIKAKDILHIYFDSRAKSDSKLGSFEKIVPGIWDTKHQKYTIQEIAKNITPLITNFLILTRLDPRNILKIKNLDSDYAPLVQAILGNQEGQNFSGITLDSLLRASNAVFSEIGTNGITIRELAQKTGLSMVAISNFKAGKDIRLSNFLKIVGALGLKMKLE